MVGRITEEHLDSAEETFPGIGAVYDRMDVKPRTFLELLWLYESKASALLFKSRAKTQPLQVATS